MKKTLKRELKVIEIVASDAFEVSVCLISGCFLFLIFFPCWGGVKNLSSMEEKFRVSSTQGRWVGINYKNNIVSRKKYNFFLLVGCSISKY